MSGVVEGAVVVALDEDVPPIVVSPVVSWDDIADKPAVVTQSALTAAVAAVPEQARDALGAALVAGANITITVNDAGDQITIASTGGGGGTWASLTGKPTFATVATTGSYNDLSDRPTNLVTTTALDAAVAAIPEQARDALGTALVAGAGIDIAVSDAGDQITITALAGSGEGGGITVEDAQDVMAALIAAGTHSGITFAYNDAGNALSATVPTPTWASLTGKPTFAAVATSGSATDITTGTLPYARVPIGTSSGTVAAGDDTRMSNPRTPTAHAHPATDITTGTLAAARLPIGTTAGTVAAGDDYRITNAVLSTQRGPLGGVQYPSYASSVTPDADTGVHLRYTATGNMTINVPSGGIDGQRLLIEVLASGGTRTLSVSSSIEVSGAAPSRSMSVPSGTWGYIALLNRYWTWRLVSMDPLP